MVWLHGDDLQVDSGSHPLTDGTNLAACGNMLFMNLNHCLNIYGFLYLE